MQCNSIRAAVAVNLHHVRIRKVYARIKDYLYACAMLLRTYIYIFTWDILTPDSYSRTCTSGNRPSKELLISRQLASDVKGWNGRDKNMMSLSLYILITQLGD